MPSGKKAGSIGAPGLQSGKRYYVSNHAVKEQVIMLGLGWGLVPIHSHELPKVEIEISVAWKRDAALGPAARAGRDALLELNLLD